MTRERSWGVLPNVRDLGGLGETRVGRVFRSPRLEELAGDWSGPLADGVTTIIDLRNADEIGDIELPAGVIRINTPIEDQSDGEFMADWAELLNTPRYYAEVLRRWPNKVVAVFAAIADAPDGGILIHCAAGRDRTGMITAMLLTLAGVDEREIVTDYLESVVAMNTHLTANPHHRERARTDTELADWTASVESDLRTFLEGVDVERYLLDNGLSPSTISAVRDRLIAR